MPHYTLITGASSGIGLQLAERYAARGQALILTARRTEPLQALRGRYPDTPIEIIAADLSDPEQALDLYRETERRRLTVRRLINNAGFGEFGNFAETDLARETAMIQLNIQAVVILSKCFLPQMQAAGQGEILNVASVAGFMPGPQMAVYYATKAFVVSFTKALRHELHHSGIYVGILAPGPTDTGFVRSAKLEQSNLFDRLKAQTAGEVAECAIDGIGKKALIIPKLLNKIMVFGARFAPDWLLLRAVAYIQKKKTG